MFTHVDGWPHHGIFTDFWVRRRKTSIILQKSATVPGPGGEFRAVRKTDTFDEPSLTLPYTTLMALPALSIADRFLGSRSRSRSVKRKAQHRQRPFVNAGLLRFPRASHIQDLDLI
jgi:hypothetical protein